MAQLIPETLTEAWVNYLNIRAFPPRLLAT
jgi:hypothetical protein